MQKNANFLGSLRCAWAGIWRAVRTERNLRFHLCIANLICVFAWFFGISRAEWGLLFLAIAFMVVAELFNTAIEQAADAATEEYSSHVKMAKDVAAGGVLTAAVTALFVGCILFLDLEKITYTLAHIFMNWGILLPCLLLGAADVLFLIFGGERNQHEEK